MHTTDLHLTRIFFIHTHCKRSRHFAVFVDHALGGFFLIETQRNILTFDHFAAQQTDKFRPVATVGSTLGQHQNTVIISRHNTAQLTPNRYRHTANLLKLACTVNRSPRIYTLSSRCHIQQLFRLKVNAQALTGVVFTINIFRNIFRDIASRTTTRPVDAFKINTRRRLALSPKFKILTRPKISLCFQTCLNCRERWRTAILLQQTFANTARLSSNLFFTAEVAQAQLVTVFTTAMFRDHAAKIITMLSLHKQKAVPMRRTIMMRLSHPKTINLNIHTSQFSANPRPYSI